MNRLITLLSSLALGACSVFGVRDGTEEPKFTVIDHVGGVEIRQYGPRVAAEAAVAGDELAARNQGFRILAGYIFGGNTARSRIAMTAPVAQASGGGSETIAMTAPVATARDAEGRWVIRFFMPAGSTLENLPVPNDPRVKLSAVPAETMAVLRFSGSTSPEAVAPQAAALRQALSGSAWRMTGPVIDWFYDPPWTIPALRRNEVAVPVSRAGG
jgi:hypothetical protein